MIKKEGKISYGLRAQIEIIIYRRGIKKNTLYNIKNKSYHLDVFFNNYKIKKKKKHVKKKFDWIIWTVLTFNNIINDLKFRVIMVMYRNIKDAKFRGGAEDCAYERKFFLAGY